MPPTTVPSRQALRYLARLGRANEQQCSHRCTRASSSKIVPARQQTPSNSVTSSTRLQSISSSSSTTPNRTLTTTARQQVQPSQTEPEDDPQNRASPTLPDITNYYTLFPNTIPDGPPTSTPRVQSEDQSAASPSSSSSSSSSTTPKFEIHQPTLRREFLQLQSQHHPDKYPTSTPAHQKALALSALINNAYKTLSDPLLRAQYLLQLQYDIDVTSEDNAAHPTDQGTLMEVMEAQERIEEAKTQEDIDGIKEENRVRIRETEQKMAEGFERMDAEVAKGECVRLKYWKSLQQGLDDWEPGKEVRLIH